MDFILMMLNVGQIFLKLIFKNLKEKILMDHLLIILKMSFMEILLLLELSLVIGILDQRVHIQAQC